MKKKLAIFATHPIQYQTPIWRALAQLPEFDLQVYYGSDFSMRGYHDADFGIHFAWDVPLTEGYAHTFLSTDPRINGPQALNPSLTDLRSRLLQFRPDYALVNGYSPYPFIPKILLVLRWLGIPILMRTEATDEALDRGKLKEALRNITLNLLYRQIFKLLAIGHNSRLHYLSKGVPDEKIGYSPYSVDSARLEQQAREYWPKRLQIREELGFGARQFLFLFSGKLIPKKDPLLIVEGFRQLSQMFGEETGFIVMGDGQLRQQFEAGMSGIPRVKAAFVGFQNQSAIGRYFSAADCLILPSRWGETWGLVVNEALQFGIPAIVSNRVGCRHNLIVEQETGFVFPVGDAEALARRMVESISWVRLKRKAIKEACRRKANDYSLEKAVAGIRDAIFD